MSTEARYFTVEQLAFSFSDGSNSKYYMKVRNVFSNV